VPNRGDTQLSKIYDEVKRAEQSRHGGNVVGAGLLIKGQISGNEDLLVDGRVEGSVQLGDRMLTVGSTGKLAADVVAREVVVYGAVKGNVAAGDRIEIKKNGSVVGDLTTARIVIEDGANIKGSIEIVKAVDAVSREKPSQGFTATAAPANSQGK
jgi:cytoskeletal protein CcmA (bactofilin family)